MRRLTSLLLGLLWATAALAQPPTTPTYNGLTLSNPGNLSFTGAITGTATGGSTMTAGPLAINAPFVSNGAQFLSQWNTSTSGGSGVSSNSRIYTTITGAPNTFIWNALNVLDYNGTGGTGAHVGTYSQALRRTAAAGGAGSNPQIWAGVFENRDLTGQSSSHVGAQITTEFDLIASGPDDGNSRQVLSIVSSPQSPPDATMSTSTMEGFYTTGNSSAKVGIGLGITFTSAALDFINATSVAGAPVIRMAAGQNIVWDGLGGHLSYWDSSALSGAGAVHFNSNFQVDGTLYVPNSATLGGLTVVTNMASLDQGANVNGHAVQWNASPLATTVWDGTILSGAGGIRFNTNVQVDGTLYAPANFVSGGLITGTAGAAFSGAPVTVDGNSNFRLTSQTNGAASSTATLTNAPSAGNPTFWIPVLVNGVTRFIPAW